MEHRRRLWPVGDDWLKALAEKEKVASDPRGQQRERKRRISQHRNLREGVTIRADYYERRQTVQAM
jgi:hypothetical protein